MPTLNSVLERNHAALCLLEVSGIEVVPQLIVLVDDARSEGRAFDAPVRLYLFDCLLMHSEIFRREQPVLYRDHLRVVADDCVLLRILMDHGGRAAVVMIRNAFWHVAEDGGI